MHFHLPKPLHGWREFTGEVGIIVIGVLIALGAQQVVEAAQWRSKVNAVIAFQRRFRPDLIDGVIDGECRAKLLALLLPRPQ
jgi:hypothetical protein